MFRVITKLSFIIGLTIGVFLAVLIKISNKTNKSEVKTNSRPFQLLHYNELFKKAGLTRQKIPYDTIRYSNKTYLLESKYLFNRVNVLCVILVKTPKNAEAGKETWAKHCNAIQLVTLSNDKKKIPIKRTKETSTWALLCKTLKNVPERHKWVLIVYDYTFVLMENLRLFLISLNPNEKYYLGHAVNFWSSVYNMGQAGYVLSKGSIDSLKTTLNSTDSCTKGLTYRNQEDYYLGKILGSLNITPADTRDTNSLSTFHPYNLYHVFFPGESYYKFSIYPQKCCSPYSITFQSIEGDKMYTYYYLLYTLQIFYYGNLGNKPPPKSVSDDEIWQHFLQERNISINVTSEQYYKVWENIVEDPTSFAKHMKKEEYFDYL